MIFAPLIRCKMPAFLNPIHIIDVSKFTYARRIAFLDRQDISLQKFKIARFESNAPENGVSSTWRLKVKTSNG